MAATYRLTDSTTEATITAALEHVVGLVTLTSTLAAERDRYRDALRAIALPWYTDIDIPAAQRIAREALESRRSQSAEDSS